ncbi:MAG: porin [Pseudolabrys sp.]
MLVGSCAPQNLQPVQYVKICSLYGVGLYYIPGTDMCIKLGGWVRAEYAYGDNGNFAWGWGNGNFNNRTTNNSTWRSRGYITADARSQTEYGTVRGYLAVGLNTSNTGFDNAGNTFSANRAFIQWAGFTFGLAQSFFDFYSSPATSYWGSFPASDTGDGGWMVGGYTAQFGNGLSATVAAEMRRTTQIVQENLGAAQGTINPGAFGGPGAGAYGGFQAPDIVGNLRIDQAWGSAQIMGALHQVNPTYYTGTGTSPASQGSGHPDDKLGFVIGAGLKLNAPMIGQGDFLQVQINYTEGALRYVFQTPNSNWGKMDGASAGWGVVTDAVYGGTIAAGTATGLSLTTAWNVNAAYDHFWNARWRTSLYGGYAAVSYDSLGQRELCGFGIAPITNGCDMNWQTWWLGSRTQWNVTKDFYMGVDVLYSKLQTANVVGVPSPLAVAVAGNAGNTTAPAQDVDNWQFRFRVHRDFYP